MARLAFVLSLAFAAIIAPSAHARGTLLGLNPKCGPTSKPFAQFGDYRNYVFAPDGGLEYGGFGWSLSGGAKVVAGNESFFVHSRYDSRSLYIPAGGSATTPPMCMGTTSTWIRFFMKHNSAGSLRVQLQYRSLLGTFVGVVDQATLAGNSSWAPTPALLNLQALNCLVGAGFVQMKLTATDGSFQVDDVYVDPWASSD